MDDLTDKVAAIVERSGGTIHIQSVVGKGTEVTVVLPARPSSA